MKSGIYTITNLVNGKIYIGYSVNIQRRWEEHICSLNGQYHENSKLQKAWNKYGKKSFIHELLVECEEQFLASEEHYWCNLLNVHNDKFGYNIRPTTPYNKPKLSKESRNRLSESQKKVWKDNPKRSLEQSKRMKGKQYGKGHVITKENREKINEGKKNAYYSDKAREAMGHMKGKTHTEESRKKISEAGKGRICSEKSILKLIERNKGNKYGLGRVKGPEELQKMRVACEKRKENG